MFMNSSIKKFGFGHPLRGHSGVRNLWVPLSPDRKSITFVIEEAGVNNIWIQPVDGSEPKAD